MLQFFVYSALEIQAWQFLKKRRDGQSSKGYFQVNLNQPLNSSKVTI
jgi:hypothetical protein